MSREEGSLYLCLKVRGEGHAEALLQLLMETAYLSHEGMSPVEGSEGTRTLTAVATAVVGADLPCTC